MQDSPVAGSLSVGSIPALPLAASYYHWQQRTDHRGRPRGKPRFGTWHFATSTLSQTQYEHLLDLMLSHTAQLDAHAEYGRSDGQGLFVTVWGTGCYLTHLHEHFDARGTLGREPGWILYFTLAPQEMGRTAGQKGEFIAPVGRDYVYNEEKPESRLLIVPAFDALEILFKNNTLLEIKNKITSGIIPRKYTNIISIDEQSVIAFYTTAEGYRDFNMALRGNLSMTPFFTAQEKVLNAALAKLPKHIGSVIRGTGSTEIDRLENSLIGDMVSYDNFVSSSLDESIADDFMERKGGKYVLRIQSKKGVRITEMSLAPSEDEILFSSKSQFKVTGKSYRPRFTEDDPLIREIYLEEI